MPQSLFVRSAVLARLAAFRARAGFRGGGNLRAIGLSLVCVAAFATSSMAQTRVPGTEWRGTSSLPPYGQQVAEQQHLRFYSAAIFGCRSPAADNALADVKRESEMISQMQKAMLGGYYSPFGRSVSELSGPARAQYDGLSAIVTELVREEFDIETLPPCYTPLLPINSTGLFIGTGIGMIPTRSTYDDGFKVDGLYGNVNINGGYRVPIGFEKTFLDGTTFVGVQIQVGTGFGTASKEFAQTQLPFFGTLEGQIGTVLHVPQITPITVYGGVGGALADIRVGSSFPGFSWWNSQTVTGFTASVGAETPLAQGLKAYTEARYLYFPFNTFHSPTGSFQLKQEAFMWTAGFRVDLDFRY